MKMTGKNVQRNQFFTVSVWRPTLSFLRLLWEKTSMNKFWSRSFVQKLFQYNLKRACRSACTQILNVLQSLCFRVKDWHSITSELIFAQLKFFGVLRIRTMHILFSHTEIMNVCEIDITAAINWLKPKKVMGRKSGSRINWCKYWGYHIKILDISKTSLMSLFT